MTVYIVGAGPGDPKLLTLRADELIRNAPVIIYTGSLVPRVVLDGCRPEAKIYDSKGMTLDQIISLIQESHAADLDVVRLHTGDPSIFGSTAEQCRKLDALHIPWEIVPGVSSFTAAAAAIKRELTLPETCQTLIISRAEGRTPMPPGESLSELGRHGCTLALFLSINLIAKIVRELEPHYGIDCPVVVVYKASMPDQEVLWGTLGDIQQKVRTAKIQSQSIIFVGRALTSESFADSRLYADDFRHRFRRPSALS